MSDNTQIRLPFQPEGEGDNRHQMTDDRITRSLKNKAEEVYKLIVASKKEYDRCKPDYQQMVLATKGKSHETWVMYKDARFRYETIKAMRDFVEDYPSMQCSRIELLRALLKSLADRNVIVNVDENILESAGC